MLLKKLPQNALLCLAKLFNASLKMGYAPERRKNANVIMLVKPEKNPGSQSSYRPLISLTNTN
ncbi:hypothetical protein C0J52_11238 [Blattella germanica]|nr:hypothetical protein C0J52_11238 [Blattella germanica]